jgi:hypothetical protein
MRAAVPQQIDDLAMLPDEKRAATLMIGLTIGIYGSTQTMSQSQIWDGKDVSVACPMDVLCPCLW